MTPTPPPPDVLLQALLADDNAEDAPLIADDAEDVDALIDELEVLFTEAKRVPFGKKLMIDEERAIQLVDRFRTAVPSEVKQAHRVLDEQERILSEARAEAQQMLEQRGLLTQLGVERDKILNQAHTDADRIRHEADRYVRGVLQELGERVGKIQTSVQNGLDALTSEA